MSRDCATASRRRVEDFLPRLQPRIRPAAARIPSEVPWSPGFSKATMTEITPRPGQEPERQPGPMAAAAGHPVIARTPLAFFGRPADPGGPDGEGQATGQARK